MERARGDEQDVVGLHRAVLGRHGGALDQGQQVALHALARNLAAAAATLAGADLVDLVEEHDAVVLDLADGLLHHLFGVEQLLALFVKQRRMRVRAR